ncbi:MAG: hypothetical protein A2666_01725 [Parcubacteria group bacterium RIFCSPHIGHO2_01_FULL_47_10b]|nr:MAG: hypothetical protein A2666_01725 [Parcubacteria group bacterium RIFCSPHIGHO2_01_FULL_47_10b]
MKKSVAPKKSPQSAPSTKSENHSFFYLGIGAGILLCGALAAFVYVVYNATSAPLSEAYEYSATTAIADRSGVVITPHVPQLPLIADASTPVFAVTESGFPQRNNEILDLNGGITAEAALVYDPVHQKVLYEHNAALRWPIASLAKLMSAVVVLDSFDLESDVTMSDAAVATTGDAGDLVSGERLSVVDLLHALLIPSSNDAAIAFGESLGIDEFVVLMNRKASQFGMIETTFVEPSGLDKGNVSTAWDLARFIKAIQNRSLIWEILQKPDATVYSLDAHRAHVLTTTNKILQRPEIIAAKTGFTTQSLENYAALIASPNNDTLIMVILGSKNRFADAIALADWVSKAYQWSNPQ